jgi:hypothetical protein
MEIVMGIPESGEKKEQRAYSTLPTVAVNQ